MLSEVNLLTGLEQFLENFGHITLAQIVSIVLALVFIFLICKPVKKYVDLKIAEHEKQKREEELKQQKLEEAWSATQKYPEYRKQSIHVQELLEGEIQEIREAIQTMMRRFDEIEEQNKKRECSKLRDMLLQNYRHYTNPHHNPSQSWTKMEAEAFWELFREYEEAGGNGYMHTVVQPEMERLDIIDLGNH